MSNPRTVLVSVDMEGIAGITAMRQVDRGTDDYPAARALMTDEASAAVAGAFDGGASSVLVSDAHGDMGNLLPSRLDRRARLIAGSPKLPWGMVQGMERGVERAFFVGYHARAGTPNANFDHTFSTMLIWELRVDGLPMSEGDVNTAIAAHHGVPVALFTGDDVACAQYRERHPAAETVVVKTAVGRHAADSLSPQESCARITAGASAAMALSAPPPAPWRDVLLEVDLIRSTCAEMASVVPGTERRGGRTVSARCRDASDVRAHLIAWTSLAASALQ